MEDDLLWEKVLKRIKEKVNSLVYVTWFEPIKLKRVNENKFVISVPTEVHKQHLINCYYYLILDSLLEETEEVKDISFALEDDMEDIEYVAKHTIRNYS